MAETTNPEPEEPQTVAVKVKTLRWVVAAVGLVLIGVVGQTALPSQATPQKPETVAVQTQKPKTGPCDAKPKQEPVPAKVKPLCVVVAAQQAYSTKTQGSPKGEVLIAECRKGAWLEHLEWGRKHAQEYVTSCLVNEHEMWWDWMAEVTLEKKKKKK